MDLLEASHLLANDSNTVMMFLILKPLSASWLENPFSLVLRVLD